MESIVIVILVVVIALLIGFLLGLRVAARIIEARMQDQERKVRETHRRNGHE